MHPESHGLKNLHLHVSVPAHPKRELSQDAGGAVLAFLIKCEHHARDLPELGVPPKDMPHGLLAGHRGREAPAHGLHCPIRRHRPPKLLAMTRSASRPNLVVRVDTRPNDRRVTYPTGQLPRDTTR